MTDLLREQGFGPYDLLLRLSVATCLGILLGLDREIRGHAAGLRTHALVALSSATITISALELYVTLRADGTEVDPLRVVQGLAQAIGFIAAGTIFVAGGNVKNLTTAANLWLAASLGIAAGAGQFMLLTVAAGFGLLILTAGRLLPKRFLGDDESPEHAPNPPAG